MRFVRLIFLVLSVLFFIPSLIAQEDAKVRYKGANLSIESKKDNFKLEIKNHYYLDAGGFIPVADFNMLRRDDKEIEMNGDVNFYKLQTLFQGKFDQHWGYKFEFDYAKSKLQYLSMELDYYFNKSNFMRVGNMKVPGSMSINHSTSAILQFTKPMGLSLGSGRRMGLAYYHTAPRLYYALGLYTYNMNDLVQNHLHGEPEFAMATRLGYQFIYKDDEKLFAAINGYYYRPQDGLLPLDLKGGIESSLSGQRFVRTIVPESRNLFNIGAEMAYQKGHFLTYAELLGTSVTTDRSDKNPLFLGWSATATYVILGQPRAYKSSNGDFSGSPYTEDDKGLEVGARVSGLSLNSGEFVGGSGVSYSAFVSYWLNRHLTLLAQVSYLDHAADALGGNAYSISDSPFRGADFMAFQLRAAIAF